MKFSDMQSRDWAFYDSEDKLRVWNFKKSVDYSHVMSCVKAKFGHNKFKVFPYTDTEGLAWTEKA
jgi:hypothetical protein